VFSTDRSTVVADAGNRRDARARSTRADDTEPVAAGARRGTKTVLDLPDVDRKPDRDGGELVN
jgi:hypothetical protein